MMVSLNYQDYQNSFRFPFQIQILKSHWRAKSNILISYFDSFRSSYFLRSRSIHIIEDRSVLFMFAFEFSLLFNQFFKGFCGVAFFFKGVSFFSIVCEVNSEFSNL